MSRRVSSSREPDAIDEIDKVVRQAYEEFLNEDLPERLVRVLEDLKLREGQNNGED